MEENLGTSQAPIANQSVESNVDRLESELDELKERVRASGGTGPEVQQNPFEQVPTPRSSGGDGNGIIKIGTFLFVIAVLAAGFYIAKSLIGKIKIGTRKSSPTPTALVSPTISPDLFKDWKKYTDPSGYYYFSYPLDFSITDYREDGHIGVSVVKNEGFGKQYGKDYVKIKTLLLKGMNTNAKAKSEQLRKTALVLQDKKNVVSEIEAIKIGTKTGYRYKITSTGDMKAEDVVLDVGREMVRIEIEYQFVDPVDGKYEDMIGKTLSSFVFFETPNISNTTASPSALPNTGIFSTTEPSSASDSSSFGDINQ
jgi:hypothetical protein